MHIYSKFGLVCILCLLVFIVCKIIVQTIKCVILFYIELYPIARQEKCLNVYIIILIRPHSLKYEFKLIAINSSTLKYITNKVLSIYAR